MLCIKRNAKAPKQNPVGHHMTWATRLKKHLPILMACCLSVRYEVNQLRAVPDMPYHVDRRVMRILWSMVSKAADMSSRVRAVTFPLSMLRLMSLCTFKRAVSVE